MLFPALRDPDDHLALRFGDVELTYAQVRDAAAHVAGEVGRRVAHLRVGLSLIHI